MKAFNKYFLLLICFSLVSWSVQAQNIISEDFESGALPTGWTTSGSSIGAGAPFPWAVAQQGANTLGGSSNYLLADSDAAGNGSTVVETITSSAFDATGNAQVLLEWDQYINAVNAGEIHDVEVWDGSAWQNVYNYVGGADVGIWGTPDAQSIDITAHANAAMQVRFTFNDNGVWGWFWAIDNVVVKGVNCPAPSALMASNITTTAADLAWVSNSGTFTGEYGPAGFTPGSGTALGMSPMSVSGLSPATAYDFYVVDDCGGSGLSDTTWGSFVTLIQAPVGITCSTTGAMSGVVFSEEFNDNSAGWTNIGSGGGMWEIPNDAGSSGTGADNAHSGTSYMNYEATSGSAGGSTVSPAIGLNSALDAAELSFWMHAYGAGMGDLTVGVGNSVTGPFTPVFTQIGQLQTSGADPWTNVGVDLTAYIGQTIYIEFSMTNIGGFTSDMSIDLMEVTTCLTCPAPTMLAASNLTATSGDLSWTSGSGTSNAEYGMAGFVPGTGTALIGVTSPQTMTLMPNTTYDAYVLDDCGSGDLSDTVWTSFTTPCTNFMAPFIEDWEGNTNVCWTQDAADQEDWVFGQNGTPSFGTGPSDDHTLGAGGGGTYIFLESSGAGVGDIANLTATVDLSGLTTPYAEVWYHMYGTNTGTLNLDIEVPVGSGNWLNAFSVTGDQGDQWLLAEGALIPFAGLTVGIRIQAISGGFTTSDIAVDDIRFKEAPTCLKATNLAAMNITATTADLSWTTVNGTSNIEYGPAGFTPGTGTATIGATSPVAITGLMPATVYDFYVVEDCGSGDISDTTWASFSTLIQGALGPNCTSPGGSASVVFTEEFDNNNAGWTGDIGSRWEIPDGATSSGTGAANAHSGANYMNYEATGGNAGGSIVSPAIDLTGGVDDAELSFWMHAYGADMGDLTVGVSTSVTGPFTPVFFHSGQLQTDENDPWTNVGVNLGAYVGQTIYIELDMSNVTGFTSDMSIDLMEVSTCVSCPTPTALTITPSVTQDSFFIDWTTTATMHSIEIVPSGAPQGSGTVMTTGSLPYMVTGLTACSDFDVYVRDDCGGGAISLAAMGSLTTPAAAVVVAPYSYGFEDSNFSCWTQSASDTADWFIGGPGSTVSGGTGPSAPASGQRYAYIETSTNVMPNAGDNAILISPSLDINGLTNPSLSFEYNMNGATIGTLNVSVEAPAGSGNLTNVWSLSGNQGDVWNLVQIDLSAYSGTIAVHFEGIRSTSFTGDISIDNFFVGNISCFAPTGLAVDFESSDSIAISWNGMPTDLFELTVAANGLSTTFPVLGNSFAQGGLPHTTTFDIALRQICAPGDTSLPVNITAQTLIPLPAPLCGVQIAPYTHSFETGGTLDTCWIQGPNDTDDWTILTGPTGSTGTGPSGASDGSFYAYLETSGSSPGDNANLYVPTVDVSAVTLPYLLFDYHMFGLTTGTLNVDVESPIGSGIWINVWTKSGDQGDQWFSDAVDLSSYGSMLNVRFTAISGGSFTSDISIDKISILELPVDDLSIIAITPGMNGCNVGFVPVTVTVKNDGLLPVTNFSVAFDVNGTSTVTEMITDTIDALGTLDYSFATNATVPLGYNNLTATTVHAPDPNNANNAMTTEVVSQPTIAPSNYTESWETDRAGWYGTGNFERGTPANTIINSASDGANAWVTNLDGNYGDGLRSDLVSPCFDLSNFSGDAILNADIWHEIEAGWDLAYVEYSIDGGMTWAKLGANGDPNWYNSTNTSGGVDGDGWSGQSSAWISVSNTIPGSAGQSSVKVRFVMESDNTVNEEGFAVDKVSITESCPMTLDLNGASTDETVAGNADGTAMVAPTAGTAPYTYMWSNTATTATITNLAPGNYGVTVTDANGCTDDATFTIGTTCPVNLGLTTGSNPEIGVGSSDGSANVSVSGGAAPYTYMWSTGATTGFANGLTGDSTYMVTVTDANGCTDVASVDVLLVFETATSEIEGLKGIALTPNPTMDVTLLQVEFEKAVDLTIEVVDIMGRVLQTHNEGSVVSEQFRLDLSNYAAGTYYIKLSANGQVMARPVVLMK